MTISKKNMKWIPWLLILPVVLIRGFTTVYPILMTVKNSFFNISILAGINEFIGFKNYLKVFSDPKVLTSISFTAIFVVASMIFHVILGVILALILNMKFKGRRFLRTIVLIPWAMPAVVAGMAAKWAFNNPLVCTGIPEQLADQYRYCKSSGNCNGPVEGPSVLCNSCTFRTSVYFRRYL